MNGLINLPTGPKREYAIQQKVDRVEGFDMLRGIAAVMVVVSHIVAVTYNPQLGETTTSLLKEIGWSLGAIGVDLFLVLSGFVVARAYRRQTAAGLIYFDFLRGRFIRLMPIYLTSLMLAVVIWAILQGIPRPQNGGETLSLIHERLDFLQLLSNLFPIWVNHGQIILNPPWWTITVEIIAAIIMPLLIAIALKRGPQAPLILGVLIFVATLALDSLLGLGTRFLICLAPIAMGVVMGIVPLPAGKIRPVRLIIAGSLILGGVASLRPAFGDFDYLLRIIAMSGSGLVLFAFSTFKIKGLGTRFLRQLGCASYTLYALHFPIIIMAVHMAPKAASNDHLTLIATLAGLVAIAISFPISKLIDDKAITLSRAYTSKKAKALEQNAYSSVEQDMLP